MTNNNTTKCAICGNPLESNHWKALYCNDCKKMPSGKVAVYGLHDGDDVIRYIGSTHTPAMRLMQHRTGKENNNKIMWLWLNHEKSNIQMIILAIVDKKSGRKAEELYIRQYRQMGNPLLNERQAIEQIYTKEEKQSIIKQWFATRPG